MLRNYLKITWRNLTREKSYAAINILGLSVGLAACLVIGLYVHHEWSYDRFHDGADRIYRVVQASDEPGQVIRADLSGLATTPPGLAQAVEDQVPGIERSTVVHTPRDERTFEINGVSHLVDNVTSADSAFFGVFDFEFLHGDPEHALTQPGEAVLSRSVAERLYGRTDVVGNTFTRVASLPDTTIRAEQRVVGVIEDPPTNSHLRPDVVLSLSEFQRGERYGSAVQWHIALGGHFFVRLDEQTDPGHFQQQLDALVPEDRSGLALQPLTGIHLHSQLSNEFGPVGDASSLYLFGTIGLVILLIALVNYVNLATARAARRHREIGIRKTVGAQRSQLVGQFLGESALTALLALPITLVLARATLPFLNRIAGQELSLTPVLQGASLPLLIGIVVLVGILAGLYPALSLSASRPSDVLYDRTTTSSSGARLRRGLVVFQFAASMVLLIATLVVERQLNYVQAQDLGFNPAQVVTFPMGELRDGREAFKSVLDADPNITSVTAGPPPGLGGVRRSTTIERPNGDTWRLRGLDVDYDYFETVELPLLSGRTFSRDFPGDQERAIILNEVAARELGLPGDPVGSTIVIGDEERTVVGLVPEYHHGSLRQSIGPLAWRLNPDAAWTGMARLAPGQTEAGRAALQSAWQQVQPDRPFTYRFLDERVQAQYQTEQQTGRLFALFAALAILIACLGLFGLAAYAAERRRQEIGIRKVLGATAQSIVALLSKDFLKLVLIGFVLAAPVAYYAMSRWLEDFAYRIDIGADVFVMAGAAALAIALLTVSYQALRAAWMNPTEAIRNE